MNERKLETVIGLEIHIELSTKRKMFCSCDNRGEDAPPNTTVCEVCMGHPGTLPVPNAKALEATAKLGLALEAAVNLRSRFERKSYFYPDLPKGYQITQYREPLVTGGTLTLPSSGRSVRIERVHLEEDTAKTTKVAGSLQVDYNRAGTPLVELVTEPDLHTPAEAREFAQELQLLVKALGISDAEMQKGHLRVDANISLRPVGEEKLYPKVEVKNINSFKFVEKALAYEMERQRELWDGGEIPEQETRGWDEASGTTLGQRTKEGAADYRYFPEPDLPPLVLEADTIARWKAGLPETTHQRRARLTGMGFAPQHIEQLLGDPEALKYVEAVLAEGETWARAQKKPWDEKVFSNEVGNWAFNRYPAALTASVAEAKRWIVPTPENFAEFLWLVLGGEVKGPAGMKLLTEMIVTEKDPDELFKTGAYGALAAGDLKAVAEAVIAENPSVAEQYRGGKTSTIQFFVGKVMAKTKGQADADDARSTLEGLLKG